MKVRSPDQRARRGAQRMTHRARNGCAAKKGDGRMKDSSIFILISFPRSMFYYRSMGPSMHPPSSTFDLGPSEGCAQVRDGRSEEERRVHHARVRCGPPRARSPRTGGNVTRRADLEDRWGSSRS
eukprot:7947349-Pyramimonas_sp.AAC.1